MAPALFLVLYRTERKWRFGIFTAASSIVDGHLDDLDPACEPNIAQEALLGRVSASRGSYRAEWKQSKSDWWVANLTAAEGPLGDS
jgi:hypothetical protein